MHPHTMDTDALRCGRSGRPACLLALLAALLCGSAQAASYLGCFDVNQLRHSVVSHSKGPWSVLSCEARCRKGQHPLFGLAAQDLQCVCGSDIPNGLHQLTDANCLARTVESLALYYSHHDENVGCRLAPLPFAGPETGYDDYWIAAAGTGDKAVAYSDADELVMQLHGVSGPCLISRDLSQYGMYSAKLRVSEVVGAVSAFYLSSSLDNKNVMHDEIDFEYVNGMNGNPTDTPGSVWTNFWIDGKSMKTSITKPAALQTITQQRSFQTYTDYHTYVIDWQPTYIRWYIDGRLFLERSTAAGAFTAMPDQYQATMVSLWTKTNPKTWRTQKDNWGGVFDPSHPEPYETFVANVRRVLCDLPEPQTMRMGVEPVPATFEMPSALQAAPIREGTPQQLPPGPRFYPPPQSPPPPSAPPSPQPPPPQAPLPPAKPTPAADASSSSGSSDAGVSAAAAAQGGSSSGPAAVTSQALVISAGRIDGPTDSPDVGTNDASGDAFRIGGTLSGGEAPSSNAAVVCRMAGGSATALLLAAVLLAAVPL